MQTILFAGGDEELGALRTLPLDDMGWRLTVVPSAAQVVESIGAASPGLIVLDVDLPGSAADAVAEEIHRHVSRVGTPVVLLSARFSDGSALRRAIDRYGAVDGLAKPFTLETLSSRLWGAMGYSDPSNGDGSSGPMSPPSAMSMAATPSSSPADHFIPESAEPAARWDLSVTPVHELFATLGRQGATGHLALHRDKARKLITLCEGWCVGVRSNLLSDCLGQVLVSAGMLSPAQCDASLEQMRVSGLPQGEVLVWMGLLDRSGLTRALELQLEAKLYDLFSWRSGDAFFVPRTLEAGQLTVLELSPLRMIRDGLVRSADVSALRSMLGPDAGAFAVAWRPGAADAFLSLPKESRLASYFEALDLGASIDEALASSRIPLEQGLALVAAMRQLGLAELVSNRSELAAIPVALDGAGSVRTVKGE